MPSLTAAARTVVIEVYSTDALEMAREKALVNAVFRRGGLKALACQRVCRIYQLTGNWLDQDPQRIAKELLCDAVVENFAIDARPELKGRLFADIWYKPGVTDPVGDSVVKAIASLSISGVRSAQAGKRVEVRAASSVKSVPSGLVRKLAGLLDREMLNPLVQECKLILP